MPSTNVVINNLKKDKLLSSVKVRAYCNREWKQTFSPRLLTLLVVEAVLTLAVRYISLVAGVETFPFLFMYVLLALIEYYHYENKVYKSNTYIAMYRHHIVITFKDVKSGLFSKHELFYAFPIDSLCTVTFVEDVRRLKIIGPGIFVCQKHKLKGELDWTESVVDSVYVEDIKEFYQLRDWLMSYSKNKHCTT